MIRALLLLLVLAAPAAAQTPRLTDLSLDELANIEVTSVSRTSEPIARAPAAIYVITADDIRRAGVRTLAEALRLAPNLLVARADAGQYAISARGFNGIAANKLLVLLDGRTLYTPLFSGVFWDQQDVLVEDIERIEVISGAGATLWGSNAVNGVINITTRPARETQGVLVSAGGGNRDQLVAVRYGAALGGQGHLRIYGKGTHIEPTRRADGVRVPDDRGWLQAGFRADLGNEASAVTLQGDAYRVETADRGTIAGFVLGRGEFTGQNLLGRWTRRPAGGASELQVQAYVDHARRVERILFQPESLLLDVELQHATGRGRHRFVWGGGYRHGKDDVEDGILVGFRPTSRGLSWANAYAQDTVQLTPRVALTAGLKLERNSYTGWEVQPNGRAAWMLPRDQMLWGAVSRAVRAPARLDRDVIQPIGGQVFGGPNFVSEVANTFQVGYRAQPLPAVTWSLALYRQNWDRLRSGTSLPVILENRIEGPTDGVEAWGAWQVVRAWRLTAGGSALRKRLRLEPGSTDPIGVNNTSLGNDPTHQWMVRSSFTPRPGHEIDALVRHVGQLQVQALPAYTAVDARYGWRVHPSLELSLVGQNLFDESHPEFGAAPGRNEIERAVFVKATWTR
jgi:iron complex outermembrane receptor protein